MENTKITDNNVKKQRGRPTKYMEELPDKVIYYTDHFNEIEPDSVIPTIAGLSLYIGIDKTTIYDYAEQYPDFSNAIKYLQGKAEKIVVNSTLNRKFAEKFATFYAINCLGYSERKQIDVNTKGIEELLRGTNGDKY